jgi:hypothetical protein
VLAFLDGAFPDRSVAGILPAAVNIDKLGAVGAPGVCSNGHWTRGEPSGSARIVGGPLKPNGPIKPINTAEDRRKLPFLTRATTVGYGKSRLFAHVQGVYFLQPEATMHLDATT